jgi:hypothetical protein
MIKQGRGGRIIGACSLAGKRGEFQLTRVCSNLIRFREREPLVIHLQRNEIRCPVFHRIRR